MKETQIGRLGQEGCVGEVYNKVRQALYVKEQES